MATISAILQDIAAENAALQQGYVEGRAPPKRGTREKIESMVREGAKNYPAYLKLIYTGESDFSSEDEAVVGDRTDTRRRSAKSLTKAASADVAGAMTGAAGRLDGELGAGYFGEVELDNESCVEDLAAESATEYRVNRQPKSRLKRNVGAMRKSKSEDSFYDTIETSSPEYAHSPGTEQKSLDPEEEARQRKEMEEELAKLEEEIVTLRTVLGAKVSQATELKRKLGITPVAELKNDLKQGLQNIRQSEA